MRSNKEIRDRIASFCGRMKLSKNEVVMETIDEKDISQSVTKALRDSQVMTIEMDFGFEERLFRMAKNREKYPPIDKFVKCGLGQTLIICGSGPSLANDVEWIRGMQCAGATVGALNTAYDFLYDNGIKVDIMFVTESRAWAATYFTPRKETEFIIASNCDDAVFKKLDGFNISVAHFQNGDDNPAAFADFLEIDESHMIGGGSTAGLRFMRLSQPNCMWFTETILAGFDSSFVDDKTHVRKKEEIVKIDAGRMFVGLSDPDTGQKLSRRYETNRPMFLQMKDAEEEILLLLNHQKAGLFPAEYQLNFIGRGLLPDWAALHHLHLDPTLRDKLKGEVECLNS